MRRIFNAAIFAVLMLLCVGTASAQNAADDLDSKYATNLLKAGDKAPDFKLDAIDGRKVSLADYRGRYVVIDFWASWCPDCRRDVPAVVDMYNNFKEKGVEFLGISFDTKTEAWKNCVDKMGIKYQQASELKGMREAAVAKDYRISWIPTMYVVDPHGRVALATVMSDKVREFLTRLFPDCDE